MRITVTETKKRFGVASFLFLAIFAVSAYYTKIVFDTPMIWVGGAACVSSALGALVSLRNENILLQIDERGIFDRRTGIGKIRWREITDVRLQEFEGRLYLSFELNNPERFASRLRWAQREKLKYHQSLGFKGITVDITVVDVDPMDLKRHIETRVARTQKPRLDA